MSLQSMKPLIILSFAFVLTACGTINRVSIQAASPEVFASQKDGAAIFSVGAKESCVHAATGLYVLDATTGKRVDTVPAIFIDNFFQKSDFADHHGAVDALSLAPGKYYLQTALVNPFAKTIKTPKISFDVNAGETVYLGELYMPSACALSTSFEIHDRFARDMDIVRLKNVDAMQRPAVKRLMQFDTPTINP